MGYEDKVIVNGHLEQGRWFTFDGSLKGVSVGSMVIIN